MGRPLKTFDSVKGKLPIDWKQQILDLGDLGGFDIEYKKFFHDYIGFISNDLWDRWLLDEEEFSETLKCARTRSARWFSEKARTSADKGKDFNATIFIWAACNAHPTIFRRNRDSDTSVEVSAGEVKVKVVRFGDDTLEIEGGD